MTFFAGVAAFVLWLSMAERQSLSVAEYIQPKPGISSALVTSTVYLPIVTLNNVTCDFSGSAVQNGHPASNILVGLNQNDPLTGKFAVYTSTTDIYGNFCFANMPPLTPCDRVTGYAVYFGCGLSLPIQDYASCWSSGILPRCDPEQTYNQLQADLSDIAVFTPSDNITATLPITFSWANAGSPNVNYLLFVGDCGPFQTGNQTSFMLSQECGKPWLPTEWYVLEVSGYGYSKTSQRHYITILWP